jgi:hypothetical protein
MTNAIAHLRNTNNSKEVLIWTYNYSFLSKKQNYSISRDPVSLMCPLILPSEAFSPQSIIITHSDTGIDSKKLV